MNILRGLLLFSALTNVCSAAGEENPLLRQFIASHYQQSADGELWQRAGESKPFEICHQEAFSSAAGEPAGQLLIMCTNDPADIGFGVVPQTVLDVYVLAGDKPLRAIATETITGSGYTPVPDDFLHGKIAAVRPGEGRYGFFLERGYYGAGESVKQVSLYLTDGNRMVKGSEFFIRKTNYGTPECEQDKKYCASLERQYHLDTRQPAEDGMYPLIVDESCTIGEKTVKARYLLTYRAELKTYPLPNDDWQDGNCYATDEQPENNATP